MNKKENEIVEISNLKDMLNKTKNIYANNIAYKIRVEPNRYRTITHLEVREMIDNLGTALISLGLKNKRIAIIGENRIELGNSIFGSGLRSWYSSAIRQIFARK